MPTTARDIINLAFKEAGVLGVGQTLLAEDANDGLTYLSRMIATWQVKRWMVPALITYNALGNNAVSMTVGPAGDFDVPIRPDKIMSAYVIQQNNVPNPVSIWLNPIMSKQNYDAISLKNLNTLPNWFFYDNDYTDGFGNVYFWPIPSATYRMYITVKKFLSFPEDSLDTEFDMPPHYLEAIHYNLAIRFISAYDKPPKPVTGILAKTALNIIKNSNTQISELKMPTTLVRGRAFNIYNPDGY